MPDISNLEMGLQKWKKVRRQDRRRWTWRCWNGVTSYD